MKPEIVSQLEVLPDRWLLGDDKCDCVFQRIGEWGNPYVGKSIQIRFCCIWAELAKQFPGFVQEVNCYWDDNQTEPVVGPQPWDSEEMDMPLYLWYRQLAAEEHRPVSEIRAEYKNRQHLRPRKVPVGTGRESKQPDREQVRHALLNRLERAGWRRDDLIAVFDRQDEERRKLGGR